MKVAVPVVSITACTLAMSGCSSINPIAQDQMPQLKPGQGLAAIVVESQYPLADMVIAPTSGEGENLSVPKLSAGQNVFLFVAPAGEYCMHQFRAGSGTYTAKSNDQCFEVVQGKLSYGGNYEPLPGLGFPGSGGGMSQGEDMQEFIYLLSRRYPNIAAAAFPTGADKSVAEAASGKTLLGLCDLLSQADAGELLGLPVGKGVISSGFNSTTCTYSHSDKETVSLMLLPGGNYKFSGDNGNGSSLVVISANGHSVMLVVNGFSGKDIKSAMNEAVVKIKANLENY